MLFVFIVGAMLGSVAVSRASTEEQRGWEYTVAQLELFQRVGGVFTGQLYKENPYNRDGSQQWSASWAEYIIGGSAQATIGCSVGYHRAWANWEDLVYRDTVFYSQYQNLTYLSAGAQSLVFQMVLNPYRVVRFEIGGVLLTGEEEIWFNGQQAWFDGTTWRGVVYEPWNVIGQDIQIVWVGHGSWTVQLSQDSFGGLLSLSTANLNPSVTTPTTLRAVSFLYDGTYLEDDLIRCTGTYWNQEFGCQVVEFESLFDNDINDMVVKLIAYDQNLQEQVDYLTSQVSGASGTFIIPLGNTSIMQNTYIKVCLIDPRTGEWVWKYLSLSTDNDNGVGVEG